MSENQTTCFFEKRLSISILSSKFLSSLDEFICWNSIISHRIKSWVNLLLYPPTLSKDSSYTQTYGFVHNVYLKARKPHLRLQLLARSSHYKGVCKNLLAESLFKFRLFLFLFLLCSLQLPTRIVLVMAQKKQRLNEKVRRVICPSEFFFWRLERAFAIFVPAS